MEKVNYSNVLPGQGVVGGDELQMLRYAEDLARLYQLERQREEDLKTGAMMQKRFLTPEHRVVGMFASVGYEVAVFNRAPASVSGDFYCPKPLGMDSAGFLLADAVGHGLSAALISMRILSFIQTADGDSPEELLKSLNQDICGLMPAGRLVAVNYTVFEPKGCTVIGAGLPFPIHIGKDGIMELEAGGSPLGPYCSGRYNTMECPMEPGDTLILYTDGLTESSDDREEPYEIDRLKESIDRHKDLSVKRLLTEIVKDLHMYIGSVPPDDDITVAVFRRNKD